MTHIKREACKAMVNRFLGWKLPEDFSPDAGISFKPAEYQAPDNPHWPVGTNLFTADQVLQMFNHCFILDDLVPAPDETVIAEPGTIPAPSWQLHAIEDQDALYAKLLALEKFIAGPNLQKMPLRHAQLLQEQAVEMRKYHLILGKRIALFGSCA